MTTRELRIGIAGCGRAARAHTERLRAMDGVRIVGCADPNTGAAESLAALAGGGEVPVFADHGALLGGVAPEALAIFTPHRFHYRLAVDALQAGCHVFIEKPLSTNPQEAVDIASLARGRGRVVGVGRQYRLVPSLIAARRALADGVVGRLRLVTATMALPWLSTHSGPADSWRLDPRISGGGILCDSGDHLVDALLWTTGQGVAEVMALQDRQAPGLDVVTAGALRLKGGGLATLGISGVATGSVFEMVYHGEGGRLRATETRLAREGSDGVEEVLGLPEPPAASIDADFVAAIRGDRAPCCPASEAVETVRLLDAIMRSAVSNQAVRLA